MRTVPLDMEPCRIGPGDGGIAVYPRGRAVYDYLTESRHHPTAEDVYHAVRSTIPKISLATVYKALESLVATGARPS